MRGRLTIAAGEGAPLYLDLKPGEVVSLGRHRSNRVVLRDLHASRHHAELFYDNGQWFLRDCATLNGTRLNGQRVHSPRPLLHGHEIAIGETRLVFTCPPETDEFDSSAWAAKSQANGNGTHPSPPPTPLPVDPDPCDTLLQADELSALCAFMAASVEETSQRALVERALALVHSQTWASLTGFLSLDPEEPLPQIVVPDQADVDVRLSKQLTRAVQKQGQLVWLAHRPPDDEHSDSLASFHDAVCVPLKASGAALGALHVYKNCRRFTEREVRFIEVLAGYLAKSLFVLQSRRSLAAENVRLRRKAQAPTEEMVGASPALEVVRQQIAKVGPHDCTVLVTGESGVGKELVALELHQKSRRRDGPLVIVNCGAISPTLLEAELFGHEKGAFTGAERYRPGFFQQADYGTLFLDEIGEMTPECQVKMLRVIEGKPFRPVGGEKEVRVDVRIIAATHRDLEKMVREGKFRHDLYYRLGVPIHVPPLRERPDDIAALADHFLEQLSGEYRRELELTPAALARLRSYPWPGNVRQLRAVLEVAAAMAEGAAIDADDLRLNSPAPAEDDTLNLDRVEAKAIREALKRAGGVIGVAADILGVHRDTLSTKMKKYDIRKNGE